MHYKTIVLRLLQDRTELHEQLRSTRTLHSIMESLARELRDLHLNWQETLNKLHPGSDPSQIKSEALELALENLQDRLPSASPLSEEDERSLDEAMAYLKNRTSKD